MARATLLILELRVKFTIGSRLTSGNLFAVIAANDLKSFIIKSSTPLSVITTVESFFIGPTFHTNVKLCKIFTFVALADATLSRACFASCAL
jgi:hypothetical protein